MYIKELVLENFKSFGRKTRIPFYDDFTTVSGPNGSGKSNIIDSVLFALGLARTRGIRAEKLTDLIYNPGHEGEDGTDDGPREASVEVVLDNGDRLLSRAQIEAAAGTSRIGDVDTISIKRRVKRTEENYYSYYYLNERSVNLSDIQDLLSQAGVAPEGYNVVMQGDVTGIINMTPYRRREIIDEIAGVAEFDAKKEAAHGELDTVSERIDEADLRIEEKQVRLDQLADERETALEYRDLRDEKTEYESYRKASELEDRREDLEETLADIDAREERLEAERHDLDQRQGRVLRLQEDLEDLNAEIERKGEDEQLRIKSEIEAIKGEIARAEDRIETATERIQDAESTRRQAFVRIDHKQERIEELADEIRETKLQKASIASEIQTKEAERESVEQEIEETDTEYEEVRIELADRKEALEDAKREKNEHQREQDRLLDEARRRSNQITETEQAIDDATDELESFDTKLDDLTGEFERAEQNEAVIEEVIGDLTAEKEEYQESLSALEKEIRTVQGEYAELEATASESGDTSYSRAVTTILNAGFDGVHGTVGQLGGVDGQYATACETAAGGRLANVVVNDDGVGQSCIEHLKSRNAGRATFLPMTKMQNRSLPSLPNHEGVIDFAYNLVDFDGQYADVFSYVLGATVVVDDLETAREFMGQYRLVTLSGDLVERSGAMTGGSRSGSRYSFSKTGKGKLERVAEKLTELEDERESIESSIRDVDERLESARERKANAREQVREIETEIEAIERQRAAVEKRIESLETSLSELESERTDVDEKMQECEENIASSTETIDEIEDEIAALEDELADSRIPELTAKFDELRDEIDHLEERLAERDNALNELQLETQYAETSIEDLHDDIETAQNRKAAEEERIEEFEQEIEAKESQLEAKYDAVEALEGELAELKEDRAAMRERLQVATEKRDEQQGTVTTIENQIESREERADRLEAEIDELAAEVDEYDPDELPDLETVTKNIDRLERKMEALEPVNMLAIDEYDEVDAELETLTDRRAVLVEERDAIQERIDSYEAQKKSTFMEAFTGINEHFEDIFEQLSAGTGSLHLENEEDPFEDGLTMKAQPGDKPIQRLAAMSGGEKSLTALAFIFAIQRYNPAPFYALDEIDAFLDAVNAERVGELVDELASTAQFIVVSHRSALLERSNRAIGVTMQDDNVSTVTGIALGGGPTEVPATDD